eukprot:gene34046-biopygen6935
MPERMDREIHFDITYVVDLITQMSKYDVKCVVDYDKLVRQKLATGFLTTGTGHKQRRGLTDRYDIDRCRACAELLELLWGRVHRRSACGVTANDIAANSRSRGAVDTVATVDIFVPFKKRGRISSTRIPRQLGTQPGDTRKWSGLPCRSPKMASLLLTYLTVWNSVDLSEHGVSLEALREFESSTVEMGAAVPKVTEFADRWAIVFQHDPAVDDLVRSVSLGAGWKFNPDSVVMSGKNYVKEGFDFKVDKHHQEELTARRVVPVPEGWARADSWGHFMVKVDIESAYRHFPIGLQYLPYHTYRWKGEVVTDFRLDIVQSQKSFTSLPREKCLRLRTQVLARAEKGWARRKDLERLMGQLAFASRVVRETVVLITDNTPTKGMLDRWTGTAAFRPLLREIFLLLVQWDIRLRVKWVPSKVNTFADALSRQEWQLFYQLRTEWLRDSVWRKDTDDCSGAKSEGFWTHQVAGDHLDTECHLGSLTSGKAVACTETELRDLEDGLTHYTMNAVAGNTRSTYETGGKQYCRFAVWADFWPVFPATERTLSLWVAFLARTVKHGCLLAFRACLRKANVTAKKENAFSGTGVMLKTSIRFEGRDKMRVMVSFSKTNQFSERTHETPIHEVPGLTAFRAVSVARRAMALNQLPGGTDAPLLRHTKAGGQQVALTHSVFYHWLKTKVKTAGLQPER